MIQAEDGTWVPESFYAHPGAQTLDVRVGSLERSIANLSQGARSLARSAVRHLRDLADADLSKVQDGQVPVYDSATGTWKPGTAGSSSGPPPFPLPGAVATSISGRWYHPETITITRVFASLTTAGSTATTVLLLRNGATVATVVIAIGALTGFTTLSQVYSGPETDYMQAQVTAAGTGAQNLVVQPS